MEDHAKYLGFILGPVRRHKAYDKALQKFLDRADSWGQAGGGLYATVIAYTVYIASVVSFLVQLDALPPHWPRVEAEAFRRLLAGSSQWACPRDLRNLHLLGFPKSFVDMPTRCRAAQLRVYHLEAANVG